MIQKDALPKETGAYKVTWLDGDKEVVTLWLTREEYEISRVNFDNSPDGLHMKATYHQRATLDTFDKVAKLVKEL